MWRRGFAGLLLVVTSFGVAHVASASSNTGSHGVPAQVVPNCRSGRLHVTLGGGQGAACTEYFPLIFTNTGRTCQLWGTPRVQPMTNRHVAVGPSAVVLSTGVAATTFVVGRSKSVSAPFGVQEAGNYSVDLCVPRDAQTLQVRLAGFRAPTYLRLRTTVCTARASTHVDQLVRGTSGY